MTREEAICTLERLQYTESEWPGTKDTLEALYLAIAALSTPTREMVEKMRGEWTIGEPDVLGVPIHCNKCGWGSDHADLHKWMEYNGHFFCGHCGAPMTDEAVDMILERWKEALENG